MSLEDDVPDLIGALAERFQEYDIPTREALAIAVCMLVEALDDPVAYAEFLEMDSATVH